jgi:hypothetical protein
MIRTVHVLSLCAASALAGPINFHKEIVFTDVKPAADLWAGGVVQAWVGKNWVDAQHTYWKGLKGGNDLKWPYTHADDTPKTDKVHEGFPIQKVGTAKDGWPVAGKPAKNSAKATYYGSVAEIEHVKIDPLLEKTDKIPVWNNEAGKPVPTDIKDFVKADIKGQVDVAESTRYLTSADAYAAVFVESGEVFKKSDIKQNAYRAYGKNEAAMAGRDRRLNKGEDRVDEVHDPIFATLTDLTTGTEITSELLTLTITALAADFSISDAGIRLAIQPDHPDSWVEYLYSTSFEWVINPEQFWLRFSDQGLQVNGDRYPLAGWQITKAGDRWEAYFPLEEGLGFDAVTFRLPDYRMVDGHDYTFGLGASDGSYALRAAPEPMTLALTGSALVGLGVMLRRRERRAITRDAQSGPRTARPGDSAGTACNNLPERCWNSAGPPA